MQDNRQDGPRSKPHKVLQGVACEVNIAHHCNLTCRGCYHLSPMMRKYHVAADSLRSDLTCLAKYYRARSVRLLGGEPLLHPDLLAVIAAARESGVSRQVVVVTNGLLLSKMPDAFWKGIDKVRISSYPGRQMTLRQLSICRRNAQRFGVRLLLTPCAEFRESFSAVGTRDRRLVERIYRTCLHAHVWQCHTVEGGYFYKCPQSYFIPVALRHEHVPAHADGIRIEDSPQFATALANYLDSPHPLESCKHCLGSVGKKYPHELVSRSNWYGPQQGNTEELLDLRLLADLETDLNFGLGHERRVYNLNSFTDYCRCVAGMWTIRKLAAALLHTLWGRNGVS